MAIQITDPKLVEALKQAGGVVDLIGPDGEPFGQFSTFRHDLPPGFKIPLTDEQIEERRQDKEGLSFAEMWEEIRAKGKK
jgi:hypothetical protein